MKVTPANIYGCAIIQVYTKEIPLSFGASHSVCIAGDYLDNSGGDYLIVENLLDDCERSD